MTRLLIGLLGAAVVASGGYAAATGIDDDPARTVSLPGATDGTTGTTGTTGATTTDEAGDISGPCDEAEHRNDPRCTGVVTDRDDDSSGPGRGGDDDDDDNSGPGNGDDDHQDRSGSNSGKG